ncbi:alpha/beta-hydrolase [Thozetella sp. PMI_491]|nr:alpha/beta-hydrolase [Thozetella sp. PMI_491]
MSGLASAVPVATGSGQASYDVKPFTINISSGVPHMLDLINRTELPDVDTQYPGQQAGMDLATLKSLRDEWVESFNWQKEEASMNEFHHFTVDIEGLTIHFIHERSSSPDAIPLLLHHGWPGSFLEFVPIINNLTQSASTSTGQPVSFDVIIPSLPGFVFSSVPPQNWTVVDTARVFNTLMTKVLGYDTYSIHGTDWGSAVAWDLYDGYNTTVLAAHFALVPFFPLSPSELAAQGISLNSLEEAEEEISETYLTTGSAYFSELATKPSDIGLALLDSPIGQLAWVSGKMIQWSDPGAGTTPSVLTHNELLRTISLYYLTRTFLSATYIYYDDPNGLIGVRTNYTRANTDAPLLFSQFKYNIFFTPPALVERLGNLVTYQNHDFGGHFAGLDNPPALLQDLREIGTYWKK